MKAQIDLGTLARLIRALEFYADEDSYIAPAIDTPENSDDYMAPVDRDSGERARAALRDAQPPAPSPSLPEPEGSST